ncbi:MAG: SDR family oxidoreductase [Anaerolineales bacterium]
MNNDAPKTIVITGSTQGIGFGLAQELLKRGQKVVISGRSPTTLQQALQALGAFSPNVAGALCDVTRPQEHEQLFEFAQTTFGRVDIWVNNAGVAHPQEKVWQLAPETLQTVITTNVLGTLYGTRAAARAMLANGGGWIYNLEGFGANGRPRPGISVYGMTKAAVAFLNKSLIQELQGTPVKVAAIQPGMVITHLVTAQYPNPADLERVRPIFNIIASRVSEVTPWLAESILSNQKHGALLQFLPAWKLTLRFLTAPFSQRNVFDEQSKTNS